MARQTLLTVEQAVELCGPDERWELVNGELLKMAPSGDYASAVASAIARQLGNHVAPRRLGVVFSADAGFILRRRPDTLRSPDVAFVARERLAGGRPALTFAEMAPDLVVEVISPSDRAEEVLSKTRMWLEAGVRLVVVVYPQARLITAYRGLRDVSSYTAGDSIEFAPVFPDFTLPVDAIFADVELGHT